MVEIELTISDRLAALLPPLTKEELKTLEENLRADGRVIDPILYWTEPSGQHRNIVLDGMHRLPLAKKLGVCYHTEPMPAIRSQTAAEVWILDHALGQRNITDPQALRQIRGDLYNKLKAETAGRPKLSEDRTIFGSAKEHVAEKAGVAPSTVARDGARMELVDKCSESFAKGIRAQAFKATDEQIKLVSGLPTDAQNEIARQCRHGWKMADAIAAVMGEKPPKKKGTPGVVKRGNGNAEKPPVKEISDAEHARFTIQAWADTIAAMLSKSPTIDEYRKLWPGEKGDVVVKRATELFEALKNWKKTIK